MKNDTNYQGLLAGLKVSGFGIIGIPDDTPMVTRDLYLTSLLYPQ